jgi:hypothetical protein
VYGYNEPMHKARFLLILGIWVAILPFLGFPYSWKNILFTLSGLVLVCFSYMLYKESKAGEIKEPNFDSFSENRDFKGKERI